MLCGRGRFPTDRTVKLHRCAELRVQLLGRGSATPVEEGKDGEMWAEVEGRKRQKKWKKVWLKNKTKNKTGE